MQGQAKVHAVLDNLEDEVNCSTVAQWLTALEDKLEDRLEEIAIHL